MTQATRLIAKPSHSTALCGVVVLTVAQLCSFSAHAASTDQRLQRLERMVDNGLLRDLVQRVDTMDQELRELRGQNERLQYELQSFKRRQDTLYQDTDARLQSLESGGSDGVVTVPSVSRQAAPVAPSGANTASSAIVLEPFSPNSTVSNAASTATSAVAATAAPVALAKDQPDRAAVFATEPSMYNEGIGLLKERRYNKALEMFNKQISAYPNGRYAANALYWRGEIHYVQRDFEAAINSLQQIEARFPQHAKVADALLKLGYALYETRDFVESRRQLETVASRFSDTTAAGLAQQRLARMDAERR